jgi:hypothetical protein
MTSSAVRLVLCLLIAGAKVFSQQASYTFSLVSIDAHIMMTLRTVDPLPCVGTTIRNQVEWGEDTIVVIASGFIRPTPCVDGMDPASARISLGRQPSGETFYLRFLEDVSDDLWKVSRAEGGFQASAVHRSFTSYSK